MLLTSAAVRRLTMFLLLLLFASGSAAACGHEDTTELDLNAKVTVFLKPDITARQQADVESRLRALPDVTAVTFHSKQEAYARLYRLWADNPKELSKLDPDSLPASFDVKIATMAAARAAEAADLKDDLMGITGVLNVIFNCKVLDDCPTAPAK